MEKLSPAGPGLEQKLTDPDDVCPIASAHLRLYKTGKRTDREGKGRERTAWDKVHREEALGRAELTFSGSLWSFRERGLGELAMAFSGP